MEDLAAKPATSGVKSPVHVRCGPSCSQQESNPFITVVGVSFGRARCVKARCAFPSQGRAQSDAYVSGPARVVLSGRCHTPALACSPMFRVARKHL
jgi:hypothetical protein